MYRKQPGFFSLLMCLLLVMSGFSNYWSNRLKPVTFFSSSFHPDGMCDRASLFFKQVAMNSTGSPCLQSLRQFNRGDPRKRCVWRLMEAALFVMTIHSMKVFVHSYYAASHCAVCRN